MSVTPGTAHLYAGAGADADVVTELVAGARRSVSYPAGPSRAYVHRHAHGAPCWPSCSWIDRPAPTAPPSSPMAAAEATADVEAWLELLAAAEHQRHRGGVSDRLSAAIDALHPRA